MLDRICGSFKFKKAVDGVAVAGTPSQEILQNAMRPERNWRMPFPSDCMRMMS